MVEFDKQVKYFVAWYALPAAVLYILYKLNKKRFRSIYCSIYALMLDRFAKAYNKKMGTVKEKLFTELSEMKESLGHDISLLEIGAGSGANFAYYPKGTKVICIDPNPHFDQYLMANLSKFPHIELVDFVTGYAENMDLVPAESVDGVICTLTLCTVSDEEQCLKEILRVLKPGGKFFFLEHVAAEEGSWTFKFQKLITPFQRLIADNCSPSKQMWKTINKAGFSSIKQERFLAKVKMFWIAPHLKGVAVK